MPQTMIPCREPGNAPLGAAPTWLREAWTPAARGWMWTVRAIATVAIKPAAMTAAERNFALCVFILGLLIPSLIGRTNSQDIAAHKRRCNHINL